MSRGFEGYLWNSSVISGSGLSIGGAGASGELYGSVASRLMSVPGLMILCGCTSVISGGSYPFPIGGPFLLDRVAGGPVPIVPFSVSAIKDYFVLFMALGDVFSTEIS